MYNNKTLERLNELEKDPNFSAFFEGDLVINNKKFKSLNYYKTQIEKLVGEIILSKPVDFSVIHGDFCLANILYDPKSRIIKLWKIDRIMAV